MADPAFLVENLYSRLQFAGHVIAANTETVGAEAFRVGLGRRQPLLNRWTPTADNTGAWIKVDCASVRAATMLYIERGHNLGGHTIVLERSTNDFSSDTDVFTVTIPSTVSDDTDLEASNGALTPEGSWMKRFASASSRYWRVRIPAMGANLRPVLPGLMLGTTWEPGALAKPMSDERKRLMAPSTRLSTGYRGRTSGPIQRSGELNVKLTSLAAYSTAKTHIDGWFASGFPMVTAFDTSRAERAYLGVLPEGGAVDFQFPVGWGFRAASVPVEELDPDWP